MGIVLTLGKHPTVADPLYNPVKGSISNQQSGTVNDKFQKIIDLFKFIPKRNKNLLLLF